MANEKRLIDANALKQMFDEREADDVELYGGVHIIECFPADDAKEIVDQMPTVDAVEVVHGRWIKGDGLKNTKFIPCSGILYCSNCKNEAYWDTDYGQQKFDYCPNCGAKMDGDGNA